MSQTHIPAADGSGSFSAYVSRPENPNGSGIVVLQEIFGVNAFLRDLCDHYARLGYVAVCPDLFWRMEPGLDLDSTDPQDAQKAFGLFPRFNVDTGIKDIGTTVSWLRGQPGVTGRVGTLGFCLGGKLAYLSATRTDTDASAGYYGVGIQDTLGEAGAIARPMILHMAEDDRFVPPAAQAAIRERLGNVAGVTVYAYPGVDHAFARTGGDHYDAAAARLADVRTETFFGASLLG